MNHTNQLIGCCGLDCEACDARIATITNDTALREKTAALWSKLNGVPITPDMMSCTGCRVDGPKTPFCDKLCPIHTCVREKGFDTCADCAQMDGCGAWAHCCQQSGGFGALEEALQTGSRPRMRRRRPQPVRRCSGFCKRSRGICAP